MLGSSHARRPLSRLTENAWICSDCAQRAARLKPRSTRPQYGKRRTHSSTAQVHNRTLPDRPARTRFAPSPTGFMHVGGLRTALFSYLLAKATGGQFILRIEDTDQKRTVPGALDRICEDLQWAGIQWDEGPLIGGPYGPYQQSLRGSLYTRNAAQLLSTGMAYRCFCDPQMQATGMQAYTTSGCYQDCASFDEEVAASRAVKEQHTVRLRASAVKRRSQVPDLVHGFIKRPKGGSPGQDTILIKSDGTPTYHFANVIDDHVMQITHVIRGAEWLVSTPLHCDLYDALGWEPPAFAHVGLLLDGDRAKISKRNPDLVLDVQRLRNDFEVLPEALCNYLVLLGWHNPSSLDVMDMREMTEKFDLKLKKGNMMLSMDKIGFLQRNHVERRCNLAKEQGKLDLLQPLVNKMVMAVRELYPTFLPDHNEILEDLCATLILMDGRNFGSAKQFAERNAFIFDFKSCYAQRGPEASPTDVTPEISAEAKAVIEIITDIFAGDELVEAARLNQVRSSVEHYNELEAAHDRISKVVATAVWKHILGPNHTPDIAKQCADRNNDSEINAIVGIDEEETADLLKLHQVRQMLIMKRLRAQLCCGLRGPSIYYVIALLGVEESKRRVQLSYVSS